MRPHKAHLLRKKRGQSVSDGMSRASLGVFAVNTLAIGDEPVESESEANVSPAAKPPFLILPIGVKRPALSRGAGAAVAPALRRCEPPQGASAIDPSYIPQARNLQSTHFIISCFSVKHRLYY